MTGSWWTHDSWEMVRRNLIHIKRTPELLLDVTLSPIMFVLLFSVVFGGRHQCRRRRREDGLHELPDGGHLRADDRIRRDLHLRPAGKRPPEGHDRPIPVAADGAVVRAGRGDGHRPASGCLAVAIMWVVGFVVGYRPEGGSAPTWRPSASCCSSASPSRGWASPPGRLSARPRPSRASSSPSSFR